MAIAIIGTTFSFFGSRITGYVTTGQVNVTVTAVSSLTVNSNVNFGTSTISSAPPLTQLTTEVSDNYGTFNNCSTINGGVADTDKDCTGMEIENDGNVPINVTFLASKSAATFFDSQTDTGATFTFAVFDGNRSKNETAQKTFGYTNASLFNANNASCQLNAAINISIRPRGSVIDGTYINWTDVPLTEYLICGNLSFDDRNDSITVEFNITIPGDEPTGTKTNTFTFTGTQI